MKLTRYDAPFLRKPHPPARPEATPPPADIADITIAAIRVAGGVSALAREMGVSKGSVSAWRSGQCAPKPKAEHALRKIAGGEG